jgi:Skp family chaperone for outer membrane proteins
MKKQLLLMIAIMITLMVTTIPLCADTISYINMESIFTSAKMVKQFEENMKEKKANYEKFVTKKQKKLEKAKNDGQSDEELKELISEIEAAILPKRQELRQLEAGFQQNLLMSIKRIAKEVASELGVDVVIDNRVVFYGGLDITDLILDKLNQ